MADEPTPVTPPKADPLAPFKALIGPLVKTLLIAAVTALTVWLTSQGVAVPPIVIQQNADGSVTVLDYAPAK